MCIRDSLRAVATGAPLGDVY
jgi:hypothetical protein